jgi:MFS family permease
VAIPLTWMVDDKSDEFRHKADAAPALPLGEILRSPSFYLLAIGSLCSIGAVGATNQHLKLYLTRDSGFAQDAAANVIALVLFTSNVGRILMGWLADRFPKKYVMISIYLLVACGIPLLFFIEQPGVIYLFAIVFGIGMGGDYMIIPLMAAELFGVRVLGRVMGLIIVVDGLSEAWIPKLVGRLRDQNVNYSKGFTLMIALALAGALAVSLLPRKSSENRGAGG